MVGVSTPLGWVGTSECDLHGRAGSAWPWSPGDRAGSGRAGSVNRLSGDLAPRLAAAGEGRVLRASGGLPAAPRGLELPFLFFPEDRWSSYCLSSLAAQNICTSKLHCPATPEQADAAGSLGSTSCCSLLRGLSSGCPPPLLPAPAGNPNKAIFTVDAKTSEVCAQLRDTAVGLGSLPPPCNLKQECVHFKRN